MKTSAIYSSLILLLAALASAQSFEDSNGGVVEDTMVEARDSCKKFGEWCKNGSKCCLPGSEEQWGVACINHRCKKLTSTVNSHSTATATSVASTIRTTPPRATNIG